jgi:hypothetical protein
MSAVLFESGARLREIGSDAFSNCCQISRFTVPESVEILGDRCFEDCPKLETIEFDGSSRLKTIGARAFLGCKLHSITIPALTEEIDGSAFLDCPSIAIQVAPGNQNFSVEGNLLLASAGTEIVRYFGFDSHIIVGKKVKVLRKSCFEGCRYLNQLEFEIGSELERIGPRALSDCQSLSSIEIHARVTIIDKASFEGCDSLESVLIGKDSSLVTIGERAFASCTSLRSFDIPRWVGGIGSNCFQKCIHLYRLRFRSSESLKRSIANRSLDEALDEFGVSATSSLFRIEIEDGGVELNLSGWISLWGGGEGDLHLTVVRDL